jgi:hypothetical protein
MTGERSERLGVKDHFGRNPVMTYVIISMTYVIFIYVFFKNKDKRWKIVGNMENLLKPLIK